jgi:hypothetical protein
MTYTNVSTCRIIGGELDPYGDELYTVSEASGDDDKSLESSRTPPVATSSQRYRDRRGLLFARQMHCSKSSMWLAPVQFHPSKLL